MYEPRDVVTREHARAGETERDRFEVLDDADTIFRKETQEGSAIRGGAVRAHRSGSNTLRPKKRTATMSNPGGAKRQVVVTREEGA